MPPKKKQSVGTGYAGGSQDSRNVSEGRKVAERRREAADEQTLTYLQKMASTLSQNLSNISTSFTFLERFLSSEEKDEILNKIKDIFRGHSPTEWDASGKSSSSCRLIYAALNICNIVASDAQLASAMFGNEHDDFSLLVLIREISDQAKLIAAKSEQLKSTGNNDDSDINVATYFLQVHEKIEGTMAQIAQLRFDDCSFSDSKDGKCSGDGAKKKESPSNTSPTLQKINEYKKQMRKIRRIDFVENLGGKHTFHNTQFQNFTGNLRRLYRELMSYQQALPVEYSSSIYLRAMDGRIDLLRALIIGPEDTPYANGCFFFDIYLPPTYPKVPPKVQFLTTGSGKIRFNPNLYNNGKVCLSLLGTWSGPGWIPNESTLLQVLISIQSLIFVNDCYFNEPGFHRLRGTHQGQIASASYNAGVELGTVKYALIDHCKRLVVESKTESLTSSSKQQSSLYPEFDEVLQTHFALKAKDIRSIVEKWSSSNKDKRTTHPNYTNPTSNTPKTNNDMNSLKSQLDKYLVKIEKMYNTSQTLLSSVSSTITAINTSKKSHHQDKQKVEKKSSADVILLDDDMNDENKNSFSACSINESKRIKKRIASEVILLDDDDNDNDDDTAVEIFTTPKHVQKKAAVEVIEID